VILSRKVAEIPDSGVPRPAGLGERARVYPLRE